MPTHSPLSPTGHWVLCCYKWDTHDVMCPEGRVCDWRLLINLVPAQNSESPPPTPPHHSRPHTHHKPPPVDRNFNVNINLTGPSIHRRPRTAAAAFHEVLNVWWNIFFWAFWLVNFLTCGTFLEHSDFGNVWNILKKTNVNDGTFLNMWKNGAFSTCGTWNANMGHSRVWKILTWWTFYDVEILMCCCLITVTVSAGEPVNWTALNLTQKRREEKKAEPQAWLKCVRVCVCVCVWHSSAAVCVCVCGDESWFSSPQCSDMDFYNYWTCVHYGDYGYLIWF